MNESKLKQNHKSLFSEKNSLVGIYGIECESGWYTLIDDMCNELEKADPEKRMRLKQVKEKFGLLRTYVGIEDYDSSKKSDVDLLQKSWAITGKYENYSERVCEICGKPHKKGVRRVSKDSVWVKCFCDGCQNKWETIREERFKKIKERLKSRPKK